MASVPENMVDIHQYLDQHQHKELLRFITCGSVDDGKSTLIGRLLYESAFIYEDQLASLKTDSKKMGTQGDDIDFALLVDGLAAEREQGITIDVAYRFFSTDKRKFIVADTPGHEQYTRNMATGASTADVAVVLVDARHGIMTQTKRHSMIVRLLGVNRVILAINKMDLMDYSKTVYDGIVGDYAAFANGQGIDFVAIPLAALKGENILRRGDSLSWYDGPTLMGYLETVPLPVNRRDHAFSMPVQWVNRPDLNFRGFTGQITTGTIAVGDSIRVLPAGTQTRVESIVTFDGHLDRAICGQSITITVADDVDMSRGDIMVGEGHAVVVGQRCKATLLWMSESALVPGKLYWFKTRAKLVLGRIQAPDHLINVNTGATMMGSVMQVNDIGDCVCEWDQPIPMEPYTSNAPLGSFIVIDRDTNNTVGMGLVRSISGQGEWASRHVKERHRHWSQGRVSVTHRVKRNRHKPIMVVLTGIVPRDRYAAVGTAIEEALFQDDIQAYRYGFQFMRQADATESSIGALRQDMFRQLFDIGYAFMDAGMVFITAIRGLTVSECHELKTIVDPFDIIIVDLDGTNGMLQTVCNADVVSADEALPHIQRQLRH